jgi:hypothetical protein
LETNEQRELPYEQLALSLKRYWRGYFLPAALRRAAHRAFIDSDSLLRPAAVRPRFFPPDFVAVGALPPALRRAAQRAFIASESFLRPAAVNPLRRRVPAAAAGALALAVVPLRRAQRARAASANFARVAGDIARRRRPPPLRRPSPEEELVEPPKRVDNFCSSALICCLRESACVSF